MKRKPEKKKMLIGKLSLILSVLVGLGIVIYLFVFVLWARQFRAEDVLAPVDMKVIRIYILQYRKEHNKYPADLEAVKEYNSLARDMLSNMGDRLSYDPPPHWISDAEKAPSGIVLLYYERADGDYDIITLKGVVSRVTKDDLEVMREKTRSLKPDDN